MDWKPVQGDQYMCDVISLILYSNLYNLQALIKIDQGQH